MVTYHEPVYEYAKALIEADGPIGRKTIQERRSVSHPAVPSVLGVQIVTRLYESTMGLPPSGSPSLTR